MIKAGTQFYAGLTVSTVYADLDFETYSEAGFVWNEETNKWGALDGAPQGKKGLPVVGAAAYATHPSTEILSLYYDLKQGAGRKHWKPGTPLPVDLFRHIYSGRAGAGSILEAHNSGFEHWIWNHVAVKKYMFPPLPQAQLRCSMAKARAFSLPGALGNLGDVLNLDTKKDKEGTALLNRFSIPRNPTKGDPRKRIKPDDDPIAGPKLYAYNETDIIVESEASIRLPDIVDEELDFWLLDQKINYRGAAIDEETVDAMCEIIRQSHVKYNDELRVLTDGQVSKASELERLKGWLAGQSVNVDSLGAEALDTLLSLPHIQGKARRALEIRAAVGSASVKKAFAMRNQKTAGRLHDMFNYHGARTGRPTGEGPQPTNLPKAGPDVIKCHCGRHHGARRSTCPWCLAPVPTDAKILPWSWEATPDVIEILRMCSADLLELFFHDAMLCVSGCMRAMFVAKTRHRLMCSDFSAIEGVVIAMLAGEKWREDVFRSHGKIYEMSASKIFNEPFENFKKYEEEHNKQKHPLRAKGKVAELALGFGGWVNSWRNFSDSTETDEEIKEMILLWRATSPAIVEFWGGQFRGMPWEKNSYAELYGLEGMAIRAIQNPGTRHEYRGTTFVSRNDVLYCILISGRALTYHSPRLQTVERFGRISLAISYMTWNSNQKYGAMGWVRMETYGSRIAENVVQAVARDIQRRAMLNLERDGYPIILHVYDEIVCEVPDGYGSIEGLEGHMMNLPDWARGWPIKAAGGWVAQRYRKD